MGGLNNGKVTTYVWPTEDGFFKAGRDADVPAHLTDDVIGLHGRPIADGSDGGGSVRDTEVARTAESPETALSFRFSSIERIAR